MTEEELETREKLKLLNKAKEWLKTAHWEGNIQSLVELILSFTEPKDKQIAELKKKNAELIGEADSVLNNWCRGDDPCPHLKKRDDQLTKAKDHIKKLLDCLKQDTNDPQTNYYICKYMTEAEQFLRDTDVDNAIKKANEGLNLDKIAEEVEQDIKEQKVK